MTIHLSDDWARFVRDEVESGRYASEQEVVEASLSLLRRGGQDHGAPATPAAVPEAAGAHKPIWEVIEEITREIPDEEFLKLPVDGAEQHDHYLYGTPKRPS
jgi:Arc/MetJ-type ribon-helix-helix transcriptional regulator